MSAAQVLNNTQPFVRRDESMARHTSWRVGGPADWFCQPRASAELTEFLSELPATTPLHWVGLGSNLLVRDAGIRGAVVSTRKLFNQVDQDGGNYIRAGAGVACTQLARKVRNLGLGDAEFFAGIPGTVGGALAMNAGAFGSETWDFVESVETMGRDGQVRRRMPEDFTIAYREVTGATDEWFVSARFRFSARTAENDEAMAEMLATRKRNQPLGLPSCGSVFRNPPGDFAARLIESVALKGTVIGGAQVSPKHANFIINTGSASASDIERLITFVQTAVATRANVQLRHEVRIVGELQ